MPGSRIADRLGEIVALSDSEKAFLVGLETRERTLRKGAVLQRENDPASALFILRSGMMMSYVLLADGSRQILRFLFPGDVVAASALVYRRSPETIAALSECVLAAVERSAIAALTFEQPRLAALFMAMGQIERVAMTDRLAGLGRTSAKARVASLLIDLRNAQRMTDRSIGRSFALGLTQEEIGDATGLTAVHVNRMLRQLEEEQLIERQPGRITLADEAKLMRMANYVDRFAGIDLGWLPEPA